LHSCFNPEKIITLLIMLRFTIAYTRLLFLLILHQIFVFFNPEKTIKFILVNIKHVIPRKTICPRDHIKETVTAPNLHEFQESYSDTFPNYRGVPAFFRSRKPFLTSKKEIAYASNISLSTLVLRGGSFTKMSKIVRAVSPITALRKKGAPTPLIVRFSGSTVNS